MRVHVWRAFETGRGRRLLVFGLEGTLTRRFSLPELLDLSERAACGAAILSTAEALVTAALAEACARVVSCLDRGSSQRK